MSEMTGRNAQEKPLMVRPSFALTASERRFFRLVACSPYARRDWLLLMLVLFFANVATSFAQRDSFSDAKPLYSESQIFAIVIGQGNYGSVGNLVGAAPSAQLVARHFGRINQAGSRNLVQLLLPAEPGNRPDSDELKEKLQRFVKLAQQQIDPAQPTVVLFYFFGHGLAEGISRSAFLLPEAIYDAGPLPRDVAKLAARSLDVGWLCDQLSEVSDKLIVMVDSCRPHQQEDERFLRLWGDWFKQDTRNMRDIFNVLQLLSGTAGNYPVIFSSEDGLPVQPLAYTGYDQAAELGPLAIRLDMLLREVEQQQESLTFDGLVARLQTPVTLASGKTVRGYTKYKSGYGADAVLISTTPRAIKPRTAPYKKASVAPALPPGPPAAALSLDLKRKVNQTPFKGLLDFACWQSGQQCYLLDDATLWQWSPAQKTRVALKKDLLFPQIGATAGGRLYFHNTETHEILTTAGRAPWRVVAKDIYLGFFGQSAQADSLLVIEDDSTIGTLDKIHRLTGGKLELIASVDSAHIGDLVEWQPGVFYFSVPEQGEIYRISQGRVARFCANLRQPRALTMNEQYLFCLDQTGSILYRLNAQGQAAETWLRTERQDLDGPLLRNLDVRGFRAVAPDMLYWLEGAYLMQINPSRIRWSPR